MNNNSDRFYYLYIYFIELSFSGFYETDLEKKRRHLYSLDGYTKKEMGKA